MNTTEFIEKFAEAIDVDAAGLNAKTEFRTLSEWDSIVYLSVIAMLDEEYGIQIENATFKTLRTINDIVTYIETHQ